MSFSFHVVPYQGYVRLDILGRFDGVHGAQKGGQLFELAPIYVYLASDDSGYVTGQVLNVNGGTMTET